MLKSRVTPIIAVTALLVAVLGATPLGHAAGSLILARNSVGTAQLKKNAVTGVKIRKDAVTGVKVMNGSLMAADFKAGQLPAGPQGPKGDPGVAGSPGLAGLEIVQETATGTAASLDASAFCPNGKRAIAVAGDTTAPLGKVAITGNDVVNAVVNGNSISVGSVNAQTIDGLGVGTWSVTAKVTCAYVQ
jgi:hypothetical protein